MDFLRKKLLYHTFVRRKAELRSYNAVIDWTSVFPQMTGLSISPGSDQLVIIHLEGGNDLVLCLENNRKEERVGELVGILCHLWNRYEIFEK